MTSKGRHAFLPVDGHERLSLGQRRCATQRRPRMQREGRRGPRWRRRFGRPLRRLRPLSSVVLEDGLVLLGDHLQVLRDLRDIVSELFTRWAKTTDRTLRPISSEEPNTLPVIPTL